MSNLIKVVGQRLYLNNNQAMSGPTKTIANSLLTLICITKTLDPKSFDLSGVGEFLAGYPMQKVYRFCKAVATS
jgi:hypothetical protein